MLIWRPEDTQGDVFTFQVYCWGAAASWGAFWLQSAAARHFTTTLYVYFWRKNLSSRPQTVYDMNVVSVTSSTGLWRVLVSGWFRPWTSWRWRHSRAPKEMGKEVNVGGDEAELRWSWSGDEVELRWSWGGDEVEMKWRWGGAEVVLVTQPQPWTLYTTPLPLKAALNYAQL